MSTARPPRWADPAPGPVGVVSPLLAELVDDASIFPPGNTPMADAVRAHRACHAGRYAALVGRFVCPASRVTELRTVLDVDSDPRHPLGGAGPIRVALIADTGLDGLPRAMADVAADPRVVLEVVEAGLPAGLHGRSALVEATHRVVAALPTAVRAYVELPAVEGWETTLDVLATAGRGTKLRTGGPTAAAAPGVRHVAEVLSGCAARQVPVKCTAGLHHAVRRHDPDTGADQHGFLNILVAAGAAQDDTDPVPALSETDGARLAAAARRLDPAVRELFVGFGSCSIDEPLADLRELGLIG